MIYKWFQIGLKWVKSVSKLDKNGLTLELTRSETSQNWPKMTLKLTYIAVIDFLGQKPKIFQNTRQRCCKILWHLENTLGQKLMLVLWNYKGKVKRNLKTHGVLVSVLERENVHCLNRLNSQSKIRSKQGLTLSIAEVIFLQSKTWK